MFGIVNCYKTKRLFIQGLYSSGKSWNFKLSWMDSHGILSFYKRSWKSDIYREKCQMSLFSGFSDTVEIRENLEDEFSLLPARERSGNWKKMP